jgi:hypothetical protein
MPIAVFVVGHIVLAVVMRAVPIIAMLHAVACLATGLVIASRSRIHHVAYAVAYIAGAEVLWRMTRAGVFWEFGKYSVAAVLAVALVRQRPRRNFRIAVAYFGFLLPSAFLTLVALEPDMARQHLSFNLSGPLALALCVLFFSNLRLTADQITITFFALIGPVISIATLSYLSTVSAENIEFTRQSNSVTSGGFGPNQVSAMLGLGLLFCLLMLLERRQSWRMKGPLLFLAVVLGAQTALTFSRGGLVLAFASAFVAIFYLVRDSRTRVTLAILGALLFGVGKYVVVPRLDEFTHGKLTERYTSTKTSNRDVLASNDLEIFADNPALGVGPGVGAMIRSDLGVSVAAHTEFTRMLAEHGLLGAIAMILLGVLGARTAATARTIKSRAFVLAMLCWFTLFLLINAMRIVAPMFVFGLACSIAVSSLKRPKPLPALAQPTAS